MISGALTRWLKQGLVRGECPLCRVAHKAEREYLWYFFDEYSTKGEALDELCAAQGFCAAHADGLRRIEVDGLRSTLGISETYEDVLSGLLEQLEALARGRALTRAQCPACARRDVEVHRNARYLIALLREDDRSAERFAASPGLCIEHFALTWAAASPDGEMRRLLLDVQRRAVGALRNELTEHIRKQSAEARDERAGPEAEAWRRALWLTGGWPDREAEA
jgi:Family of unknown function (DUF6062)